jgi:UDP-N-acetylmuramoyl-L-alanyl-D-glutamate--2,6-diaminopimelate ligase
VAGAFTNLSRDHLDYHETMEAYFAAKMRLFDEVVADGGSAVVWADDAWSDKALAHVTARGLTALTVGEKGEAIRLASRTPTQLGQVLELVHAGATRKVTLPLIGAYQAANALVAAGLVIASGGDAGATLDALAPATGARAAGTRRDQPPGRRSMSTMPTRPSAIEAAIAALRPHVGAADHRDRRRWRSRCGQARRRWARRPAPDRTW